MERSNDKWSDVSGPVMDSLISKLRGLDRWKKDGPNLRLLNKHWREQVDSWISHIRPIETDKYYGNEIESLSKFVNLRQLRLDPFLKRSRLERVSIKALRNMTCLRRLSHLTDLELRGCNSEDVRFCPSGCFQNASSVVFDDVGFREGKSITLLRSSPIQKAIFIGTICCKSLKYPWIKTLRSLEFVTDFVSPLFIESITYLVSLTSLSISSRIGEALALDNAKKISRLTSLVSLHLPDSVIKLPLWMTTLSDLESLSLRINNYPENENRLWTLLNSFHSLRSLSLPHVLIKKKRFLKYFEKAKKLKSLDFPLAPKFDDDFLTLLTQLTRLAVDLDESTTRLRNLVELSLLQELSLRGDNSLVSIFHKNHACNLRNLVVLEIDWYVGDVVIEEIILIQSLKKVCFYSCSHTSESAISELRKLPNLKELCLVGLFRGRGIRQTPQLESLFDNLELLCFTCAKYSMFSDRWIHEGFPHVRITDCLEEFSNLSCIGQKTRRPKLERRGRVISRDSRI